MGKEIKMYNAYFGDCIMLKDMDDESSLLVDFGIHYFSFVSEIYGSRADLTDKIADAISKCNSDGKTSLLITHFHEDHISGLIYMHKSGKEEYKNLFANIYIANIWSNPFVVASNLLEELILEKQLKRADLPRTSASLFDLLDFLCAYVSCIKLLSRGVKFENDKYIALWPPCNDQENHISEIIHDLYLSSRFERRLLELAKNVCTYVSRELLGRENGYKYIDDNTNDNLSIDEMRGFYEGLLGELFENTEVLDQESLLKVKNKLHKLNHKYNIVFQNTICGNENLLFTGDIEQEQMNEIAIAKDIELHQHFKYIKIPHHGTKAHYFDFTKYEPENILITNGKVNTDNPDSYKICTEYGALKAIHWCANANHCCCRVFSGNATSCCSAGRKIVYSKLFKKIKKK